MTRSIYIAGDEWRQLAKSSLRNWVQIAYLLRHSLPLLGNNYKSEGDLLLPYLALGALRNQEQYPEQNLLLANNGIAAPGKTTIVDVGAFTGEFSKRALEILRSFGLQEAPGSEARQVSIIAIEPSQASFSKLQQNARENGWSQHLCAINVALASSAQPSASFLDEGGELHGGSRMAHLLRTADEPLSDEQRQRLVDVRQETLDRLFFGGACDFRPSDQILILKLDCEGRDGDVLLGAAGLLRQRSVKYLIFEQASERDQVDLQAILESLWKFGYACFMVQDRFLIPMSRGWFHPMYRSIWQGGYVYNADYLCAQIHDPDLLMVIEGFVTRANMPEAKEIARSALRQWREAQPQAQASVAAVHHLDGLPGWQYLGQSLQEYYLGDLLRSGFGAQPTRRERGRALKHFTKALQTALASAGSSHSSQASWPAYEIGHCYYFGDCAVRNLQQAIRWYRKSIDHVYNHEHAWIMMMMAMVELQENASYSLNS